MRVHVTSYIPEELGKNVYSRGSSVDVAVGHSTSYTSSVQYAWTGFIADLRARCKHEVVDTRSSVST